MKNNLKKITGMKPQQIQRQTAKYYTLRFAGLFKLPIPLRFAFGIGFSQIIAVALILLTVAVIPVTSWAEDQKPAVEEEKVTGEVAASVLSAYIWRGQEMTRHSVVIQPSMTASYKGFTANLWGNLDTRPYSTTGEDYSSNLTETDITLSYSRKFGIVQAGVGYIYYGLAAAAPGGPDLPDSQEIFVSLGLDTILAPTLTVYKEIDHYLQWYFLLGVSHTFALHEKIGLKLAASASYLLSTDENTYAKYDSDSLPTTDKYNNFHDGTVTVSLPIAVYKTLSVTPTISYVFPLSNDAKYEMRARGLQVLDNPSDKDSAYLYGGVTLSYAF
jgi:hypothetical protein